MLTLLILALAITAVVGIVLRYLVPALTEKRYGVTWMEYALVLLVFVPLVGGGTVKAGTAMALKNNVTFDEFYNGYEVEAIAVPHPCRKVKEDEGGGCRHHRDCSPYPDTETYTDSDGKTQTRTVWKTHYCPWADVETDYRIRTTLGDYTIAEAVLPADPQSHRWDKDDRIPDSVIARAGAGAPPLWAAADARIRRGDPGPVTKVFPYPNYILASQRTLFRKFSRSIDRYRAEGLLPEPAKTTVDHYYANKAYFVGSAPESAPAWQYGVMKLNAALGTELQGDLHFVVVNANRVPDLHDYFEALTAYWKSEALGRKAISKNAIIVAVSTKDGRTIDAARADTGMPIGNEGMVVQLERRLKGASLDNPATLLGNPVGRQVEVKTKEGKTTVTKAKTEVTHGAGVVESILWGDDGFDRVSMSDFSYLSNEITLKRGQQILLGVMVFLASLIGWAIACVVHIPLPAAMAARFGYTDPHAPPPPTRPYRSRPYAGRW